MSDLTKANSNRGLGFKDLEHLIWLCFVRLRGEFTVSKRNYGLAFLRGFIFLTVIFWW